jgi:hypothetical protein
MHELSATSSPRRGAILKRWSLPVAALACALAVAPAAHPQGELVHYPAALHVVAEYEVPSIPSVATSVRWASDHTVYLARLLHGVFEIALDDKLSRVHVAVPDAKTMQVHFSNFSRIAVSSKYLATSSLLSDLSFRSLAAGAGGTYLLTNLRLGTTSAFDLSENRLLFLGHPDTKTESSAGVVWIGPLSAHPLTDLRPLLIDVASAGTPTTPGLINCATLQLGTARFLGDGSFLVVPGFQPGVHLYSPGAQLVRTWQNEDLGFDAPDCAGMSPKEEERYRMLPHARFEFLNQHRVVDDILPLPQGPALLIRSVTNGTVHWVLRVLRADGAVLTYAVPFTGTVASDRLRGDVRGNRIVLLRVGFALTTAKEPPDPPGRLYLMEMPQETPETVQ